MNNLTIPIHHLNIETFFSMKMTSTKPFIFINKSLYLYLKDLLDQLQQYPSWKLYKQYINLYETISSDIETHHLYIYIELLNQYKHILDNIKYTLHISNCPVDSLNALLTFKNNETDVHHMINTSDIDITNSSYVIEHIQTTNIKYDFIYCDIFDKDYTIDNELKYSKLNLIQILYSLNIQNKHGTLILKLYDMVHYTTIEMIYLLSCCYHNITFYKPLMMDVITSEKYIICQDFKSDPIDFMKLYIDTCDKIHTNLYIEKIFTFDMSYLFIDKLIEINSILGQTQIESIKNIIHLILSDNMSKLESIKQYNHKKCIEWCQKNNINLTY
jgi:FtsJ-like methyltransferase